MKKLRLFAAALCSLFLVTGSTIPASADGTKVVTLGADLSSADQQKMLNYFKVNVNEVEILYITNQDERNHLAGYVPIEQIGTRTLSCAYVKPTTSGGIKVRTANLNWVTGNMIATTLSTSGVKNCEVIAACPYSVSGTGALTGIQMAYEAASGEVLDSTKKKIATEEIVVTGNLADTVGKTDATNIVNKAKMEIIENNVTNVNDITNIVTNIAEQNNVAISSVQMTEIINLLTEISQQNYVYEDVAETLQRVDENVSGEIDETADTDEPQDGDIIEEPLDPVEEEDSIFQDIDESVLGDQVAVSSTEDQTLEETTYEEEIPPVQGEGVSVVEENFPEDDFFATDSSTNGEVTVLDPVELQPADTQTAESQNVESQSADTSSEDSTVLPSDENWDTVVSQDETDSSNTEDNTGAPASDSSSADSMDALKDTLSEQARSQFKKAELFCKAEYEHNAEALSDPSVPTPSYTLTDAETGKKLSAAVEKQYLQILSKGTASYVPDGETNYFNDELNMMAQYLKKLFGINGSSLGGGTEDILSSLSANEKNLLYQDSLHFFEKLYGEQQFFTEESTPSPANTEGSQESAEIPAAEESTMIPNAEESTMIPNAEEGGELPGGEDIVEEVYNEEDYSGEDPNNDFVEETFVLEEDESF